MTEESCYQTKIHQLWQTKILQLWRIKIPSTLTNLLEKRLLSTRLNGCSRGSSSSVLCVHSFFCASNLNISLMTFICNNWFVNTYLFAKAPRRYTNDTTMQQCNTKEQLFDVWISKVKTENVTQNLMYCTLFESTSIYYNTYFLLYLITFLLPCLKQKKNWMISINFKEEIKYIVFSTFDGHSDEFFTAKIFYGRNLWPHLVQNESSCKIHSLLDCLLAKFWSCKTTYLWNYLHT